MELQECIDKEIKTIQEYATCVEHGRQVFIEMESFLRKCLEIAYTRGSTQATAKCCADLEAINRGRKSNEAQTE